MTVLRVFMRRISAVILFCLCFSSFLDAGWIKNARSLALSGAVAAMDDDITPLFNNIAGIAGIGSHMLSFSYVPLYGIEGFYSARAGYVFPLLPVRLGAAFEQTALTGLFTRNEALLGAALRFGAFLRAGLRIRFVSESVALSPGEPSGMAGALDFLTVDAGLLLRLLPFLDLGLSGMALSDPARGFSLSSLDKASERLLITGIKVSFTKGFCAALDQEFAKSGRAVLKLGTEMWFYETIAVRAGLGKNETYSLGAGIRTRFVRIDFGLQSHPALGNQYQWDMTLCY